MKVSAAAH